MGSNESRIARNTIFLYARMLLVLGISLYASRVILDTLGITDYGIYSAVSGIALMITFFTSALSNASQRFLSFELGRNDIKSAGEMFNLLSVIFAFFAIFLLIALETGGLWLVNNKLVISEDRLEAANWVYQFSVLACIFSIVQVPYMSCIIAEERMGIYAFMGIFDASAKLLIIFMLRNAFVDKLVLYASLYCLAQFLTTTIYIVFCNVNFKESRFHFYWEKSKAKEVFSFIGQSLFGCFAYSAAYEGTSVVLNVFWGPVANAARGVAKQVNTALNIFASGISTAFQPQIIKSYSSGNLEYLRKLVLQCGKYTALLFLVISLPILFNIDSILSIWLVEVPLYASEFTCLMIVDSIIATQMLPIGTALNATGEIKRLQVYGRIITMSALPASYLLLKLSIFSSPITPFIVLLIAEIAYWLYCFNDLSHKIKLDYTVYFGKVVLPLTLFSSLSFIIDKFCILLPNDSFWKLVLRIVVELMVMLALMTIVLSRDELRTILIFLKKKIFIGVDEQ